MSQKLVCTPGVQTVQNHMHGKWACWSCRTLTQTPVPAEIIDKGIPTAALLAHVLMAKGSDHLALYRLEVIFARAGLAIPRSTLAAWVGICGARLQPLVDALKRQVLACAVMHADEMPVAMLAPSKGKTIAPTSSALNNSDSGISELMAGDRWCECRCKCRRRCGLAPGVTRKPQLHQDQSQVVAGPRTSPHATRRPRRP